jgi:hypothetical protein
MIRATVHKLNIERYETLLMGDLTPYERQYLEQQIQKERAAMRLLFSGASRPLNAQPENDRRVN